MHDLMLLLYGQQCQVPTNRDRSVKKISEVTDQPAEHLDSPLRA